MKTANVVIGSMYGDEGKGLMTDCLTAIHNEDACVIRFNGGAQAGHTVELPDGTRHVFHHFGAGTFNGSPTFLSKYFIVNPILFRTEWETLTTMGYNPVVYVDERCKVTLPYDMLVNQLVEEHRSGGRHGSCGMGINETIQRNIDHKTFKAHHLYSEELLRYLANIRYDYYPKRIKSLGIEEIPENYKNLFINDNIIKRYMDDVEFFKAHTLQVNELTIKDRFNHVVFEGAQGLLLDEEHYFFPNVTRSKTGLHNVIELSRALGIVDLDVHYMTRAYTTRHGAGEMPSEMSRLPYAGVVDKTNINNEWQGSLRFSYLNLDLLAESIKNDLTNNQSCDINIKAGITVTCLDQITEEIYYMIRNNQLYPAIGERNFLDIIQKEVGIPIWYASYGATNLTMEQVL